MVRFFQRLAIRIAEKLNAWAKYDHEQLVSHLVLHTSSLELARGTSIYLAPVKGVCGPFTLSGNSLPVFKYTVFEKNMMEFVRVTVEISKPARIQFTGVIESTDKEADGKEVEVSKRAQGIFFDLAYKLVPYFPYSNMMVRLMGMAG